MNSEQTETEIGTVLQETICAARDWQKTPSSQNFSEYDRRFGELYQRFYPFVYRKVKVKITPFGTERDIEELCDDIFMAIWEKLHQFQ